MMSSQSRQSVRTVRTLRSAWQFARGELNYGARLSGYLRPGTPHRMVPVNLVSRSRIRTFMASPVSARSATTLRATWVTYGPVG